METPPRPRAAFFVDAEPLGMEGGLRQMAQGTVRRFSEEKGYGFISPDDGGEDVFVHYSGIEGAGFRSLDEGTRVTHEVDRYTTFGFPYLRGFGR